MRAFAACCKSRPEPVFVSDSPADGVDNRLDDRIDVTILVEGTKAHTQRALRRADGLQCGRGAVLACSHRDATLGKVRLCSR